MRVKTFLTLSVLAALVIGPAGPAVADWQAGGGQAEPSTAYDSDDYMFPEANQEPVDKVYFNGFVVDGWIANADKNIEGGRTTNNLVQYGAYLGFWRDCNGDGYVGAKLTAESYSAQYGHFSNGAYPAALYADTLNTKTCPEGTAWNQGDFIDEFRWIGPNATYSDEERQELEETRCADEPLQPDLNETTDLDEQINDDCEFSRDIYDVTDKEAVAWVDLSEPEQQAASTKPVFAKETLDNSSSTLYQAVGWLGVHNLVEGPISLVDTDGDGEAENVTVVPEGTYDGLPNFGDCGGAGRGERELGGGPGFAGTDVGTCGLYPLWQAKRLVNDSESSRDGGAEPIVYVFDTESDDDTSGSACDDVQLAGGLSMANPDPDVNENPETEGSIGGTVWRNVFYGTNFNTEANESRMPFNGECGEEQYPPSVLADSSGAAGKFSVDTFMIYYPDSRLRQARDQGYDNVPTGAGGLFSGAAAPLTASSKWLSFHVYIILGVAGGTTPRWITYFADVTDEALDSVGADAETALPAGRQNAHEYGFVECNSGDYTDTPRNNEANDYGWICNSGVWQEEADEFNEGNNPDEIDDRLRVIVGHAYDLRDVDCSDFRPFDDGGDLNTNTGDIYVGIEGGETVTARTTCGEGQLDDAVVAVNDAINST